MRGRPVKALIAVVAVVAAVIVVPAIVPSLDDLNPFKTETKDRSQPSLLRSLESLSEYRAATGNYQQPVDIERDVKLQRSCALDTRRGLINRVGDLFDDDNDDQRELLLVAERRIARAAQENPGLLTLGARNTRTMLTGMLRAVGFEDITLRFARPPAT